MDITNQRIGCPNIERKCYIFYQPCINGDWSRNKLIGELIEQENDAGENMFLFNMYHDLWDEIDWKYLRLTGLDIQLKLKTYVRSGILPYFIECRIPPKNRGNIQVTFSRLQIDYYDPFEMIMRSRGICHHDFCYIGRTPTDFFDRHYYKDLKPFELSNVIPNLPCGNPENDFHSIK